MKKILYKALNRVIANVEAVFEKYQDLPYGLIKDLVDFKFKSREGNTAIRLDKWKKYLDDLPKAESHNTLYRGIALSPDKALKLLSDPAYKLKSKYEYESWTVARHISKLFGNTRFEKEIPVKDRLVAFFQFIDAGGIFGDLSFKEYSEEKEVLCYSQTLEGKDIFALKMELWDKFDLNNVVSWDFFIKNMEYIGIGFITKEEIDNKLKDSLEYALTKEKITLPDGPVQIKKIETKYIGPKSNRYGINVYITPEEEDDEPFWFEVSSYLDNVIYFENKNVEGIPGLADEIVEEIKRYANLRKREEAA